MFKIKQKPEDFIVKEIMELKFDGSIDDDSGGYSNHNFSYYKLTKQNYNTVEAVNIIAKKWAIRPKFINFAGAKDKKAVTEQYISISKGPKRNFEMNEKDKWIKIVFLGKGSERINLGALKGNRFEIVVYSDKTLNEIKKPHKIINYFDDQRFGVNCSNHLVGRALLRKDFREACSIIGIAVDGNRLDGNNYVSALRGMPKRLLRMYIAAYQSYVWNECVKALIDKCGRYKTVGYCLGELFVPENIEKSISRQIGKSVNRKAINRKIPLVGFGSEEKGDIAVIIDMMLEKDNLTKRDFIMRQMPELSSDGGERDMVVDVKDLAVEKIAVNTYKVMFELAKGSYATIVIKTMFS